MRETSMRAAKALMEMTEGYPRIQNAIKQAAKVMAGGQP
jgi:hypothetical protein